MPNYIANEINFSGNKDAIEKVINAIQSDDGQNCIDFKHTSIQKTNEYISKRSVIKIINHAKNAKAIYCPAEYNPCEMILKDINKLNVIVKK